MASKSKTMRSWMGSASSVVDINSENIAEHFTPSVSMKPVGLQQERVRTWQDVPKEVGSMTKSGMLIIGNTCLKENASFILKMYEEACLMHVVGMQIKDKTFSALVRGNPALERDNPGMQKPNQSIAQSSLLGQDPWGDKAIPEDSDNEEGETSYSKVQMLLKNIQDQNYGYLTTHLKRILYEDIFLNVRKEEVRYEKDIGGRRSSSERNRMPWEKYKSVIYELLPEQTGLHELKMLMTLNREDGESAQSWVQRLTEANEALAEYEIVLPERLFVEMAVDYLSNTERSKISEKIGSAQQRAKKTKQKLLRELFDLKFEKLVTLVGNTLEAKGDYRLSKRARLLKQLVFTRAQAHLFFGYGPAVHRTKPVKRRRAENPREKLAVQCRKCLKAGLKGRRAAHRTEDCKDEVREKAVRKMLEKRRRRESAAVPKKRPNLGKQQKERKLRTGTELVCQACKNAGRKHRHDPKKCKFAPGGEWHGKTKDELRVLQKRHYEQMNLSRQEKELTHQVEQLRKRRKLRHAQAKSKSNGKAGSTPLWRKETTLVAMQRNYADAENNVPKSSREASTNNAIRSFAPTSDDERTRGELSPDSADESDSQSEAEAPLDDSIRTPEGEQSDEGENLSEDEEEETSLASEEKHPGVVEAEESNHAEEGRDQLDSPKSNLEIHPEAPSEMNVAAAEKTSEAPKEEKEAEAPPNEVIDLVSSDEEAQEEPMTQEEFLRKRKSIRRGEWTKAKELLAAKGSESEASTEEEEDEEPEVHVGPTFRGPPLCGPLRAESLKEHLENMRKSGASAKEIADRKREITPVCYMMNESSDAGKEEEEPEKEKAPPSPMSDEADALFLVTPCDDRGTPLPPGDPFPFPLFLDEPVKYMIRDLKETFPLRPGR